MKNFKKTAEFDSQYKEVTEYISKTQERLIEKAEEYTMKTLNLHPYHPKANYEMALVYFELGQKEKALEHIKRAINVWENPDPEFKPAKQARDKLEEWESKEISPIT